MAQTAAPALDPAGERRGLLTLLGNEILLNIGFYMLIPLISVHFTQNVGLSAGAVGLVLGTRPLLQNSTGFLSGALADRIGYRAAITLGLLIRAVAYVIIGFADDFPQLLAGSIVFGIGGALIWANGRAAMAAISAREKLAPRFAIANILENLISALAPVAGIALLKVDFAWVGLTAAVSSAIACLLVWFFLPAVPVAGSAAPPIGATFRIVWKDRAFVLFTLLMAGHWFLFGQLFITVPLEATRVTGTPDTVGLLYVVYSATVVALTYVVIRAVSRVWAPLTVLPFGLVLMAIGLGSYAWAAEGGLPLLIGGIVVYGVGWMLAEPMRQTVNAEIAPPEVRAAYFGFSMLSIGIGASAGQFAGGWLYDLGRASQQPALPWIACAIVGSGVALALVVFKATAAKRWAARLA